MLNQCMKAFSGRRISKVISWGWELGLLMWLSTSVEAYRSWIFEVTWNLVMVGALPSDEDWEIAKGKRRNTIGRKSFRIIFNVLFWENVNGGVWTRTPQTRLADKSRTAWTLTPPMTQLQLPIIQGKFVSNPKKSFSAIFVRIPGIPLFPKTLNIELLEFLIWHSSCKASLCCWQNIHLVYF